MYSSDFPDLSSASINSSGSGEFLRDVLSAAVKIRTTSKIENVLFKEKSGSLNDCNKIKANLLDEVHDLSLFLNF